MKNEKEQTIITKPRRSKKPDSQEPAIGRRVGQQYVQKSILEIPMKDDSLLHRPNKNTSKPIDNHIVYESERLVAFGREAVMRPFDPDNTPFLTDEEREILRRASRRGAHKVKKSSLG